MYMYRKALTHQACLLPASSFPVKLERIKVTVTGCAAFFLPCLRKVDEVRRKRVWFVTALKIRKICEQYFCYPTIQLIPRGDTVT